MTTFFAVAAGASATLVGLLFVAVQVGPPLVGEGPIARRHAMARSTFTIFVVIFTISLVFLFPSIPTRSRAIAALAAVLAGAVRAARTWLPVWREKTSERSFRRYWEAGWLLVGPILAYAYLAYGSVLQLLDPRDATVVADYASAAFVALFVIALRNSWDLLVEATVAGRS